MKKVVVIGGGTGSFSVLKGLKKYPLDITAIVTTFDSGGSTGILRDELGVLPPGDIRRCLVALSDERDENVLRELFSFRFGGEKTLKGHSFGNLFLTALTEILGDEVGAIQKAGELLKVKGKVLPVSTTNSHLEAVLEDGTVIRGEANIDVPKHNGDMKIVDIFLKPKALLNSEAKKSIEEADLIVIGPGDIYTSLVPNLLVEGMREALNNSRAKIAYVVNIMTKWGETTGLNASSHAKIILDRIGRDKFDYLIANETPIESEIAKRYSAEKSFPVILDDTSAFALRVIKDSLASQSDIIRHDSDALASLLYKLL